MQIGSPTFPPFDAKGIFLGYPFDQLFDRNCELEYWLHQGEKGRGTKRAFVPAIKLPSNSPGTGNIVISGPPGSGKSTLALQWAVKCAFRNDNRSNAAYFSLESSAADIITKAKPFGWDYWLREARSLKPADEFATPDTLSSDLIPLLAGRTMPDETDKQIFKRVREAWKSSASDRALGAADETKAKRKQNRHAMPPDPTRCVLLFSLSPRPLNTGIEHDELLRRRYQQIERLLIAADRLSEPPTSGDFWKSTYWEPIKRNIENRRRYSAFLPPGQTVLPLIVVDSLNMFGIRPLSREELFRLFALFRKYRRIGVFVVESTQDTPFDSTMADVVVSLSSQKDRGYLVQHFEIEKSRYFNQVNGLHPYKPSSPPQDNKTSPPVDDSGLIPPMPTEKHPSPPRSGIVAYPSLHYVVLRTERTKQTLRRMESVREPNYFGIQAFNTLLPRGLHRGSAITIEGPSGTFKTTFALNFLASGLQQDESALLIRLSDIRLLQQKSNTDKHLSGRWVSQELSDLKFKWEAWSLWDEKETHGGTWSNLAGPHKTTISVWRKCAQSGHKTGSSEKCPTLFELDFKSGSLLPEEFVEIVREILNRRTGKGGIRRVVLDDVSQIGVSYPFLRQSITTGDIFLSAFVHIMRNAGVDLIMTATTSGLASADDMVKRACSLADAVLSCRFCDVFGERHVTVQSEGLMARKAQTPAGTEESESVPSVVRTIGPGGNIFQVDSNYLSGLVGFESGKIHRPGLVIHLFEDNKRIHGRYNEETMTMLQAAFATTLSLSPMAEHGGGVGNAWIQNA